MRKRSAQKDLDVHKTVNAVVEIVFGAESSSFRGLLFRTVDLNMETKVLIFEEKLADKETGIQILRNQVQQKSKSIMVEEIVETHVADKKDTIEDSIVTMEDENEDY
ncbi:hypothetical protein Tco_1237889 [Tanacetum coccineum]